MSEEYEDQSTFETAKAEARKIYPGLPLQKMIEFMKAKAEEKANLEDQLKLVNAHYDVLRLEVIPEKMDSEGIENIRLEGIGRVSLTGDMFVQILSKGDLFNWLKDNGLSDLIQPTVNSSTLKAFVKRRIKEGKPFPADFLRVTPVTRATITKA